MHEGFYKQNNLVLSFDLNKELDLIKFDHYIKQKENLQRIKNELPKGCFYLSIRNVSTDLDITFSKAQRIIKKFEDLNIISLVKKGQNKQSSIFKYKTIVNDTKESSNNATLNVVSDTKVVDNKNHGHFDGHNGQKIYDQVVIQNNKTIVNDTKESSNNATLNVVSDTKVVDNAIKNTNKKIDTNRDTKESSNNATLNVVSDTNGDTSKKENIKRYIYIGQNIDQRKQIFRSKEQKYIWSLYPNKVKKQRAMPYIKKLIETLGIAKLEQCIKNYIDYIEQVRTTGFNRQFQDGDRFFRDGYLDYLNPKKVENTKIASKEIETKVKIPTLVTDLEEEEYY